MRQQELFPRLAVVFRLVIGAIFLYAGAIKVADPAGFAQAIYNYHILPGSLINLSAIILPWVEIIAGICLIAGIMIPGASLLCSGLFATFAAALGFSLARGLDISCGCFSTDPDAGRISTLFLVRDLAMLAMSLFTFFAHDSRGTLPRLIKKQ